jgi:hypothetical protein
MIIGDSYKSRMQRKTLQFHTGIVRDIGVVYVSGELSLCCYSFFQVSA